MKGRVLINLSVDDARAVDRAISERIGALIDSGDVSTAETLALWDVQKRFAPRIQIAAQSGRTLTTVKW